MGHASSFRVKSRRLVVAHDDVGDGDVELASQPLDLVVLLPALVLGGRVTTITSSAPKSRSSSSMATAGLGSPTSPWASMPYARAHASELSSRARACSVSRSMSETV